MRSEEEINKGGWLSLIQERASIPAQTSNHKQGAVSPYATNRTVRKVIQTYFLNTLKDPYYSHLIGHTTSSFAELVIVGERVGSPVWSPSRHASFANTSRTVRAIVRSQESTDQKTGIRADVGKERSTFYY